MKGEDLKSTHTVMSYELDSFGHVNNAVYLNYLEKARNDFMIQKGLDFYDFFKWKLYPVVMKSIIDYKIPARAGDQLDIIGKITNHTATSFTLTYEITESRSKKIIATAETRHVFINDNNRPSRIPQEFFQKFIKQN
jgi:acyl-CoA thioester hydrolase